jgi:hypothetical protein
MAFYARDFLSSVVAFFFRAVSVLDGLRINNQKSGARAATMALSSFAN